VSNSALAGSLVELNVLIPLYPWDLLAYGADICLSLSPVSYHSHDKKHQCICSSINIIRSISFDDRFHNSNGTLRH